MLTGVKRVFEKDLVCWYNSTRKSKFCVLFSLGLIEMKNSGEVTGTVSPFLLFFQILNEDISYFTDNINIF